MPSSAASAVSRSFVDLSSPERTEPELWRAIAAAKARGVAGVVLSPWAVKRVTTGEASAGLLVVAHPSPDATGKPAVKAIEASSCVKDGAHIVLVSPRRGLVRVAGESGPEALRDELTEIIRGLRAATPGLPAWVEARWAGSSGELSALATAALHSGADALVLAEVPAPPLPEGLATVFAGPPGGDPAAAYYLLPPDDDAG